jgi:hypothetical protein
VTHGTRQRDKGPGWGERVSEAESQAPGLMLDTSQGTGGDIGKQSQAMLRP